MDKCEDKLRRGWVDQAVSPYLKRPLRSLARVLASRTAADYGSADRDLDSLRADARPFPPGLGVTRTVTD